MRPHTTQRSKQGGFGAIAAIVVLVILASLSGAILRFGTTQQLTLAQDIQSASAWQAAKAGTEWGLHQVLQAGGIWRSAAGCSAGPETLDLSATAGFRVTVTCAPTIDYSEGESAPGVAQATRGYRITATACNAAGGCPNNAAALLPNYVERVREVITFCPVGAGADECP